MKGTCRTMAPFYGYVKRSMNRAPGKNDTWWARHQSKCSGIFEKVSEPENFKNKSNKKSSKSDLNQTKTAIKSEIKSEQPTTSQSAQMFDNYFNSSKKASTSGGVAVSAASTIKPEAKSKSLVSLVKKESSQNSNHNFKDLNQTKTTIKSETKSEQPTTSQSTQIKTNTMLDSYFNSNKKASTSSGIAASTIKAEAKSKSLVSLVKKESSQNSNENSKLDFKKRKSAEDEPIPQKAPRLSDGIFEIAINKPKIKSEANDIIVLNDDYTNKNDQVECPVCFGKFHSDLINSHVNSHF